MVVGNDPVDSQEITHSDLLDSEGLGLPERSRLSNGGFSTEEPHSALEQNATTATIPAEQQGDSTDWQDNANWASESTQRFRRQIFTGIAIAGGLLLVAILVMWSLSDSASQSTVAKNPAAAPNDGLENPPRSLEDTPAAEPSSNTPDDASQNVPSPLIPDGDETEQADPGTTNDTISPPPDGVPPTPGSVIPAELMPMDVLGGEDGGPPTTPSAATSGVVPEQSDEPAADPLTDLPPELASFVNLLDLPGNAPDAPPVTPGIAPADDLVVDQAADAMLDPMLLATPPPDVNIDNALKFKVAIQTAGYPLTSFVLVCSELTQVPIQVDWFTLDLAGIPILQKVDDPQPGWKAIGDLMDAIAAGIGMEFEQEKTRLLLTLTIAEAQAKLKTVVNTDDFGVEQESAKTLVDRIANDPRWNEREQLNLRALVTDCLRIARGMDPQLPEPALAHWTARADGLLTMKAAENSPLEVFTEQWPLLEGGQSGPQLDTAITLAGLLRQTAQANQVACIVNWDDARQRRLTPGQLVLPYANQPAGQMLAKTLAPMGLQVRTADAKHWWVGTAATYDRMPLLVIGDEMGPRRDEILQRIRDAAARTDMLIFIEHDPVSDRYLAMMPRFLYRQLPTILRPFSQ